MNGIFCVMLLGGVVYAAVSGRAADAQQALLAGGTQAVQLCLSLAGPYAFFGGVMGLMRESGLADALAQLMRRPMRRLFRFEPGEEAALGDICLNLSANLLGMGGAATPAGLRAMRAMASARGESRGMSGAMQLFLVMNMTGVQLLPGTMIGLRAQAGAANPADIVLPSLMAAASALCCGVLVCSLACGYGRK